MIEFDINSIQDKIRAEGYEYAQMFEGYKKDPSTSGLPFTTIKEKSPEGLIDRIKIVAQEHPVKFSVLFKQLTTNSGRDGNFLRCNFGQSLNGIGVNSNSDYERAYRQAKTEMELQAANERIAALQEEPNNPEEKAQIFQQIMQVATLLTSQLRSGAAPAMQGTQNEDIMHGRYQAHKELSSEKSEVDEAVKIALGWLVRRYGKQNVVTLVNKLAQDTQMQNLVEGYINQ